MINTTKKTNWHEANQHYLTVSLNAVKESLEHYVGRQNKNENEKSSVHQKSIADGEGLKQAAEAMPDPSALNTLCSIFNLSPFERNILLLCAGMEMDSRFAPLCAKAQGDSLRTYPTFSLALAVLPEAHWSAITPTAPLRYWRLIDFKNCDLLTTNPLRIDERVLHYLAGIQYVDERLSDMIEPIYTGAEIVPSHHAIADRISNIWSNIKAGSLLPVIQLSGDEPYGKRAVSLTACSGMGLNVYNISASVIPLNQAELNDLIRLWERESAMSASAVYLDCEQLDISDSLRMYAVTTFIERFRGAIIISSQKQRLRLHRQMITFDVHKPTVNEQRMIWQDTVSSLDISMNGQAEKLVSQFNLSSHSIHTINSEAVERLSLNGGESGDFKEKPCDLLWNICLAQTRPHLEELAQRIKPVASLDDIVLPEHQKTILKEIAVHVRNRFKVYEDWGFVEKSSRGLGISALFIGDSGTGKTMAAEVLANELRLDLYRIDLSQVVSKYIGETEKNIKRVFDAAENGGAVLLFDEADALFGKRSEVKDSHDRYANIEISYLLQRMEAYRGLAILTTNMKDAVDTAFLRRIRFVVQFPFPDSEHRAEIWKRVFPTNTPVNGLEIDKLSRLNIAGGNICNIAMNAAFLAADKDESVSMKHILNAVRNEYAKLEKTLSTAEIGGWGDVQH